jgi:hypothetical protein
MRQMSVLANRSVSGVTWRRSASEDGGVTVQSAIENCKETATT